MVVIESGVRDVTSRKKTEKWVALAFWGFVGVIYGDKLNGSFNGDSVGWREQS